MLLVKQMKKNSKKTVLLNLAYLMIPIKNTTVMKSVTITLVPLQKNMLKRYPSFAGYLLLLHLFAKSLSKRNGIFGTDKAFS